MCHGPWLTCLVLLSLLGISGATMTGTTTESTTGATTTVVVTTTPVATSVAETTTAAESTTVAETTTESVTTTPIDVTSPDVEPTKSCSVSPNTAQTSVLVSATLTLVLSGVASEGLCMVNSSMTPLSATLRSASDGSVVTPAVSGYTETVNTTVPSTTASMTLAVNLTTEGFHIINVTCGDMSEECVSMYFSTPSAPIQITFDGSIPTSATELAALESAIKAGIVAALALPSVDQVINFALSAGSINAAFQLLGGNNGKTANTLVTELESAARSGVLQEALKNIGAGSPLQLSVDGQVTRVSAATVWVESGALLKPHLVTLVLAIIVGVVNLF